MLKHSSFYIVLWIGEKVLRFFALSKKYGSVHALGHVYYLLRAKVLRGMSIIVYFVMITECGNEKVARSVIHRRKSVISCVITEYGNEKVVCSVIRSIKVVILCVITEYGNKNIVCFVIHRIKLVILEDITDSGE